MFTWICPKCGKEVPPHESECPYCHGTGKVEAPAAREQQAPPQPQPPHQPGHYFQQPLPPQQPQPPAAPPQYPPPPPQQYAPPPAPPQPAPPAYSAAPQQPPVHPSYAPPPAGPQPGEQHYYELGGQRKGLPGWAVMLLVALVAVGLGYVLYTYVLPSSQSRSVKGGGTPVPAAGESTPNVEAARIARHLEATGFRISEDSQQRAQVQFLIVNHSAADIGNLAGFVNLRVHDGSPSDPALSRVEFKTDKLGPYESIEFKTALETDLRAYELPDWQFLRADIEVTSPTSAE